MGSVVLEIYGHRHDGWTDIELVWDLLSSVAGFRLGLTETNWGSEPALQIEKGAPCRVSIDGELVCAGMVRGISITEDAEQVDTRIEGATHTADMVESTSPGYTARGGHLLDVVKDICKQAGVEVAPDSAQGPPVADVTVDAGQTWWSAIEQAARGCGHLITTNAAGQLRIVRAGAADERAGVVLRRPGNIIRGSMNDSLEGKFGNIIVLGQSSAASEFSDPELAAIVRGEARDTSVSERRTLHIIAESATDRAAAQRHAVARVNRQQAESNRLELEVQGWRQQGETGPLWRVNTLVPVDYPRMRAKGDFVIVGVRMVKNDKVGTRTTFTLMPPAVLAQELAKKAGDDKKT